MKEIAELRRERVAITSKYPRNPIKVKARDVSAIRNIDSMIYYLERYPTEESLKKQLEELERKLGIFEFRFEEWVEWQQGDIREIRKKYQNMNHYAEIKFQIKNLKHLLV